MSDKPSYLGLLNGIALAESNAHEYLKAWIAVTGNPGVREVLETVCWREGEHGLAFSKRINELGFALLPKVDTRQADALKIAGSDLSDVEKFRRLGLDDVDKTVLGYFDNVFADHTIDVQTGALLGRYIAEEFDSARLLRGCYLALADEECEGSPQVDDRIDALACQVEALTAAVGELRQAITAQPSAESNGKKELATRGTRR